jgi:hypothetical protein
VQALLLLSESNLKKSDNRNLNRKVNNILLETPSLNKYDVKSIKPRALLQLVSNVNIQNADKIDEIKSKFDLLPLFNISNRSITIGFGSKVDICLKSLIKNCNGHNLKLKKCEYISEKHACIYYDESTNTYELLNYSQHGSYVNDNYFGFDVLYNENNFDEVPNNEIDLIDEHSDDNNNEAKNPFQRKNCLCKKNHGQNDYHRQFEGAASLCHGTKLRFGCFEFLFIIVDYDFVKFNLEKKFNMKKINHKINDMYDQNINKYSNLSLNYQIASKFIDNNKLVKRLNNSGNTSRKSLILLKRNNSKRKLNSNGKLNKSLNKSNNKIECENEILNSFLSNQNKRLLLI